MSKKLERSLARDVRCQHTMVFKSVGLNESTKGKRETELRRDPGVSPGPVFIDQGDEEESAEETEKEESVG